MRCEPTDTQRTIIRAAGFVIVTGSAVYGPYRTMVIAEAARLRFAPPVRGEAFIKAFWCAS